MRQRVMIAHRARLPSRRSSSPTSRRRRSTSPMQAQILDLLREHEAAVRPVAAAHHARPRRHRRDGRPRRRHVHGGSRRSRAGAADPAGARSTRTRARLLGRGARDEATLMPLVEVRHLVKDFDQRPRAVRASHRSSRAVDDVSFAIDEGETFGLVGESGSGKTTTGRCMLRLIEPTSGEVRFRGENVLGFSRARMRAARRDMQIVFQDPYSSLNPRMRVGDDRRGAADHSPTRVEGRAPRARRRAVRAGRPRSGASRPLPARVQRRPAPAHRPGARAGAQPVVHHRRRAGVGARRLGPGAGRQPADGPAGRLKLTYLFIAHDLRLVEHICSRVAVMYLGQDRRDGRHGRALQPTRAPLHAGAASRRFRRLDPDARPRIA